MLKHLFLLMFEPSKVLKHFFIRSSLKIIECYLKCPAYELFLVRVFLETIIYQTIDKSDKTRIKCRSERGDVGRFEEVGTTKSTYMTDNLICYGPSKNKISLFKVRDPEQFRKHPQQFWAISGMWSERIQK